jgi:hypothetical protein
LAKLCIWNNTNKKTLQKGTSVLQGNILTHIAVMQKKSPYFVGLQNFLIPAGGLQIFFL